MVSLCSFSVMFCSLFMKKCRLFSVSCEKCMFLGNFRCMCMLFLGCLCSGKLFSGMLVVFRKYLMLVILMGVSVIGWVVWNL